MVDVLPFGLEPTEAIAHLRRKTNVPTAHWYEMTGEAHATAFTVAGAMKMDLLDDLRQAVQTAIEQGKSLQTFRKEFREIAAEHGWSYHGTEAWRADTILNTNARTSYAAGRYQQMQATKDARPFWEYRHSHESIHPRPQHVALDRMVLPADDPAWAHLFPPNAWGCNCYVNALSQRDMERLGLKVGDAPKLEYESERVGGQWVKTPKGFDHGWDYNVGAADQAARMGHLFAERAARVDPRIGASAMFTDHAQVLPALGRSWRNFMEGLQSGTEEAVGNLRMIGTVGPSVVDQMAAQGLRLESAGIAVQDYNALRMGHAADRGKEIERDIFQTLPERLLKPKATYLDTDRHQLVLVVRAPEEGPVEVVRLDVPRGKPMKGEPKVRRPLEVLLGGRVSREDLAGGRFKLLDGAL